MQYLVPLRFNSSVGEIAYTVERFVPALGKHLLGGSTDLQEKRCDIIPISNPRDLNQQELFDSIMATIEDGTDVHQIILDVGGPHYAGVPVNRIVGSVIAAIAKLNREYPKAHKLVMFPKKLHHDDMNYELFETNILKKDRVSCFFYHDQTLEGQGHTASAARTTTTLLGTLYQRLFHDRAERLRRKIICHLGKYSISDRGSEKIIYDYYDGHFAQDEIYSSLKDLLRKLISDRQGQQSITVAVDDFSSPWFYSPLKNAIDEAVSRGATIQLVSIASDFWPESVHQIDAVLLPIMRTGDTVINFLHRAVEAGKISPERKPLIWSLIDLSGLPDETGEGGVRLKVIDNKEDFFSVSDIKEGERGEMLASIWSKTSFTPTPIKAALERLDREFYSDEMWALIFEAGMQQIEDDIPSHRSEHRVLPNFKSIIKYNGPLIAAKVLAVLRKSARGVTPSNTVFLHPDEEATRLLAEAIYDVASFESVPVSKRLVEFASNSRTKQDLHGLARHAGEGVEVSVLDELESLEAKFKRNLTPTSTGTKVVLLTEFHTTGRSILGLYRLARMLGARSITDISLASIPLASHPTAVEAAHTFYKFG